MQILVYVVQETLIKVSGHFVWATRRNESGNWGSREKDKEIFCKSGKLSGVVRIYEMQTLQSVQFSTVSLANGEGLMEYKTPKFGF